MKSKGFMRFDPRILPYLAILFAGYIFLPLLSSNTGVAILSLFIVLPLLNIILALIYAYKNRVTIYYYLLNFLLFLPTIIFIFKRWETLAYSVNYFFATLFGSLIGIALRKYTKK